MSVFDLDAIALALIGEGIAIRYTFQYTAMTSHLLGSLLWPIMHSANVLRL